ncbi:Uncharacterised protein [uncultured archaeon]|nr:Uncharacterised protein [uncultured archaeon]
MAILSNLSVAEKILINNSNIMKHLIEKAINLEIFNAFEVYIPETCVWKYVQGRK